MDKNKKELIIGLIVGAVVLVWVFSWGDDNSRKISPTKTKIQTEDLSALEQMVVAFEGKHLASEIRPLLDKAMRTYNTPITEENYSRAGSALVGLRKEFGVAEMDVLKCMASADVGTYGVNFPDAAALCTAVLTQK